MGNDTGKQNAWPPELGWIGPSLKPSGLRVTRGNQLVPQGMVISVLEIADYAFRCDTSVSAGPKVSQLSVGVLGLQSNTSIHRGRTGMEPSVPSQPPVTMERPMELGWYLRLHWRYQVQLALT